MAIFGDIMFGLVQACAGGLFPDRGRETGKKSYFSREKGGKRELKYFIFKLTFRGF